MQNLVNKNPNQDLKNNTNGFYKKTIKKTVYSEFYSFDLFRALFATKRLLSVDLEDLTKGFIKLEISDEISNIQNAISNIALSWSLTSKQELLAINYLQKLSDKKFCIYDLAITANAFISSYMISHKRNRQFKRLKKEINYLNYCLDKEDSLSTNEIDQVNQIVATCKSGFYEKFEIKESDGDSMT